MSEVIYREIMNDDYDRINELIDEAFVSITLFKTKYF